MKIGFIGTGVMGHAIVGHLQKAGHELHVYNRTKAKTTDLVAQGATWHDTPAQVAVASEIIFTMVGYPSDVEEVYYGPVGIFQSEVRGKVLVDLTTSTPILAEKIAETAIEIMGKSYALHGGPGKGQHTKMANQIMIAGTMTGLTEMLVYSRAAGLNQPKVIETLAGGSASNWSMENYGPRILKEDYSPGFFVKHFIKDLKIALDEAAKMGLDLPATTLAKDLYENKGFQDDGTQALIKLWWS